MLIEVLLCAAGPIVLSVAADHWCEGPHCWRAGLRSIRWWWATRSAATCFNSLGGGAVIVPASGSQRPAHASAVVVLGAYAVTVPC